jgi:hypothetical protein
VIIHFLHLFICELSALILLYTFFFLVFIIDNTSEKKKIKLSARDIITTVHNYIKVMMELVDMNSLGLFDF